MLRHKIIFAVIAFGLVSNVAQAECARVSVPLSTSSFELRCALELNLDNPGYIELGKVITMPSSVMGYPRTTISATPNAKCQDGWALVVLPGSSIPMCARDLRPAQLGN